MAGMWVGGREIALTNHHLPAWLKKAMGAALSEVNRCPYCEDMLLSLTHGARQDSVAVSLRKNELGAIEDDLTRKRLEWTKESISKNGEALRNPPFTQQELPEALGTLVVFNYTNKISDFTMDGSPVPAPVRKGALRLFGIELRESSELDLEHGASLHLLPEAPLPNEFEWAESNPLVADSLARWNQVVETEIDKVLSEDAQQLIREQLRAWEGGPAPMSRRWADDEVKTLEGKERELARLVLLVAKASYQIDDGIIGEATQRGLSEADLVRLGSWGAFMGAKTAAGWAARAAGLSQGNESDQVEVYAEVAGAGSGAGSGAGAGAGLDSI